ncbi:lysozyme inhibitor LprI family protein [Rhizobium sp. PAMB 3182]
MKFLAVLAVVGLPLAASASAQQNPDVDCSDPTTQTDMNICAYQDWQAADKELNAVYKEAVAYAKDEDTQFADIDKNLVGALDALKKAQRAWVEYRDGHCDGMGFQARGGSMEPLLVGSCLADLTRQRTKELKELMTGLESQQLDEGEEQK